MKRYIKSSSNLDNYIKEILSDHGNRIEFILNRQPRELNSDRNQKLAGNLKSALEKEYGRKIIKWNFAQNPAYAEFEKDVKSSSSVKANLSFVCPKCGNKTAYCTDHNVLIPADVDYHEHFVCDECGAELLSEPRFDGKICFVEDKDDVMSSSNSAGGYWYFTRHGVQPGSIPKGTPIDDVIDKDGGSYFLTDRLLTTKELEEYEIKERRPFDKIMNCEITASTANDEDPEYVIDDIWKILDDVSGIMDIDFTADSHSAEHPEILVSFFDPDLADEDLIGPLIANSEYELEDIHSAGSLVWFTVKNPHYYENSWIEVISKLVPDSDGFLTDYTMYRNNDGTKYIFMFGDKDVYGPDPDYADYECETNEEATEWYNNYNGFEDDDEYDLEDIDSSTDASDFEDDIQEIGQEFTSENTSINSTKLPAIFNMVLFEPGTVNIDYGGGKFDNVADYLSTKDIINLVYDPYNRSREHNQQVIKTIKEYGGADTATCSNVLNVIKEPEVRLNVLTNISKLVKDGGKVYITVYEGSGKGNEGPTKAGYQLNRRTADYLEEVQKVFPDAVRKGKLIVATNSKSGNVASSIDDLSTTAVDARILQEDLYEAGIDFLRNSGWPLDQIGDNFFVEISGDEDHPLIIDIDIRDSTDLDSETWSQLLGVLDNVVQKYDCDAYFGNLYLGRAKAYVIA